MLRLEQATLQSGSLMDRVADRVAAFVGSVTFVLLQCASFVVWAVINANLIPGVPPFDPYPYPLLSMVVSTESVILSAFILINQNRMGYLSDRRDHLDLQVNLLTEREVTRLLQMTEAIGRRLGIEDHAVSGTQSLTEETQVERLVEDIDEKLSEAR